MIENASALKTHVLKIQALMIVFASRSQQHRSKLQWSKANSMKNQNVDQIHSSLKISQNIKLRFLSLSSWEYKLVLTTSKTSSIPVSNTNPFQNQTNYS